jgi:hypothetical protein
MTAAYDEQNIFAKIIRGEIPCDKVYEDEHVLAFNDIAPRSPVHILVVPKTAYVSFADFSDKASAEEIAAFMRAVGHIARDKGLDEPGYRTPEDRTAWRRANASGPVKPSGFGRTSRPRNAGSGS